MTLTELCAWLRANSSGNYRPSAEAAGVIERLSDALVSVLDGTPDHHIGDETGLPPAECEMIAAARRDAKQLLKDMAKQ